MIEKIRADIMRSLSSLLRQGMTPERLSASVSCGITVGICPLMGTTTAACTVLAIVLRINLFAVQLGNWLAWPLQAALLMPFLVFGERLFGSSPPMDVSRVARLLSEDILLALRTLSRAVIHGTLAWGVCAPFVFVLLYVIFVVIFRKMAIRARR